MPYVANSHSRTPNAATNINELQAISVTPPSHRYISTECCQISTHLPYTQFLFKHHFKYTSDLVSVVIGMALTVVV